MVLSTDKVTAALWTNRLSHTTEPVVPTPKTTMTAEGSNAPSFGILNTRSIAGAWGLAEIAVAPRTVLSLRPLLQVCGLFVCHPEVFFKEVDLDHAQHLSFPQEWHHDHGFAVRVLLDDGETGHGRSEAERMQVHRVPCSVDEM